MIGIFGHCVNNESLWVGTGRAKKCDLLCARVESANAIEAIEPDLALLVERDEVDVDCGSIIDRRARPLANGIARELAARRVEIQQPVARAEPERAIGGLRQSAHRHIGQIVVVGGVVPVEGELFLQRVEPIDASEGSAKPEDAVAAAIDRVDWRIAQAVGVDGIGPVAGGKLPLCQVEGVHAIDHRADQQIAAAIRAERKAAEEVWAVGGGREWCWVAWRLVAGEARAARVELIQAIVGRKPQMAVGCFCYAGKLGERSLRARCRWRWAGRGCCGAKALCLPAAWIKREQAAACHPHAPRRANKHAGGAERATGWQGIARNIVCCHSNCKKLAAAKSPDGAILAARKRRNAGDAMLAARDVRNAFGARVEAIKAAARAKPERAAGIFQQRTDIVAGQGASVAGGIAIGRGGVAIVAHQTIAGAEPHKAALILHDWANAVAWQAVVVVEVAEAQR